jgi:hypothetical protein
MVESTVEHVEWLGLFKPRQLSQLALEGTDRTYREISPKIVTLGCSTRRTLMSVFKKQGLCRIDYYVNGHRKRIGSGERLAETMQSKRYKAK